MILQKKIRLRFQLLYSVDRQWCLESIHTLRIESMHTLLLSRSIPLKGYGLTQDVIDGPHRRFCMIEIYKKSKVNLSIEPFQFHTYVVILKNSKLENSFQIQSLKLQKCKIVVSHQQLILHLTKEDGVIEWPFPMIRRSQMLNGWAMPATKLATPSWLTGAPVINPKSLLIAFLAWVWIHQTTGRILTQRSFSNSFMNYCYSQKQTR